MIRPSFYSTAESYARSMYARRHGIDYDSRLVDAEDRKQYARDVIHWHNNR